MTNPGPNSEVTSNSYELTTGNLLKADSLTAIANALGSLGVGASNPQSSAAVVGATSLVAKAIYGVNPGAYVYIYPTAPQGYGMVYYSQSDVSLCAVDVAANNFLTGRASWTLWDNGKIWTSRSQSRVPLTLLGSANVTVAIKVTDAQGGTTSGGTWSLLVASSPNLVANTGSLTQPAAQAGSLNFIGDFLIQYGYKKGAKQAHVPGPGSSPALAGNDISWCGYNTAAGTGSLRYTLSTNTYAWKAPSDTGFGAETFVNAGGITTLPSASANCELFLYLINDITRPAANTTYSVTVDAGQRIGFAPFSPAPHVAEYLYQPFRTLNYIGIANSQTSDTANQLPYGNVIDMIDGIDIILTGNDNVANYYVSGDPISLANSIWDMQAIINASLQRGNNVVLVGLSAQWKVAGTTALTTTINTAPGNADINGQLGLLFGLNDFMRNQAKNNPGRILFIDTFALTYDPAFTDARPKSNMIMASTTNRLTSRACQIVGEAIGSALLSKGWISRGTPTKPGDPINYLAATLAGMTGTTGTTTSGSGTVSGTVPALWNVNMVSGNGTVACTAQVAKSDGTGNWFEMALTSGAADVKVQVSPITLPLTITPALAIGTEVVIEVEYQLSATTNVKSVWCQCIQFDSGVNPTYESLLPNADYGPPAGTDVNLLTPTSRITRSAPFKIIEDTASPGNPAPFYFYLFYVFGTGEAGGTGKMRFANPAIIKTADLA